MSFCDNKEIKGLFQRLPFYDIFIEIARIKHLKNMDLLHELPFCGEFHYDQNTYIIRYARSYRIEIIDLKDLQFN